ncbi:serine--tRNA ligase [Phaeobacter gallaeciensis]|uniref:Serine--tRNA ligase n=1 Tax=Phaeobacter gallaeciensis TaxID=60890 RepID=A0AAD0ECL0_9RHOB|nr:serine--tRNA ligase [Phaeobacter gallaeciensis]AHD09260.1 seryl-tRNA synthetase [Phaeobacter gallaeciensis DSM 26640]ATE92523.1 seryl-tRNA synthetase SerS [Phaeobacter gallaeciensis]ATE97655.1 seryl-tRNA synthetase SerS [Phaeobacter gallaeciensis]ATF01188.1 seryl-tRNA synthetase SerS [Phaeobacter gallaeciensis]ATF05568.1 seryl-tRNA synthetase SerS [Phaeobacter gallaeciensis]
MHDIRAIRENPAAFDAALARRGDAAMSSDILALDESRRAKIQAAETAQADQNKAAKAIGAAKAKGDDAEFERLRAEVAGKKAEVAALQTEAKELDAKLTDVLARIPNLPAEDVPAGADEDDNVEVSKWGAIPNFSFDPKEHFEIKGVAAAMDFETAAKISGSRFVLLKGAVARIHRALAQFMVDTHVDENGLTEVNSPVLVRDEAMYGTDKLPKFGDDSYQTTNGWWLVPTSEVPLTYSVAGDMLDEAALPIRMTAHTLCFRSEAGSAGKDTSGMLRQHQFEKVEMVSIVHPTQSDDEQKRMLRCAEGLLEKLGVPYRTVVLCTGDMGFGARRTFDIEAWVPGQNTYREISSVSTTGDFQARRMNARFKPADGGKPEYLHTLNGSGLAVGRCLIAVLENGQQEDGSVKLPEVLAPYLGGRLTLTAEGALV